LEKLEKILLGKKTYYNAARGYSSIENNCYSAFDYLHDAIVECLEKKCAYETASNRVRSRARTINKCIEKKEYVLRYKKPMPTGWGWKASCFLKTVNQILKDKGFPQGRYALNGGEKQFGIYSVDFFIPFYQVVVEYNENQHYETAKKIAYDRYRRIYIEKCTDLPIIIIHEDKETPKQCAQMIIDHIDLSIEKKRFANGEY
jgi:hypothetical protein